MADNVANHASENDDLPELVADMSTASNAQDMSTLSNAQTNAAVAAINTQTTGRVHANLSDVGVSESTFVEISRPRREQPFRIVDPIPLLESVIATIDAIDLSASDNELDSQSGRETPPAPRIHQHHSPSGSNRREINQIGRETLTDVLSMPLTDVLSMPAQFSTTTSPPRPHRDIQREFDRESRRDIHYPDHPDYSPASSTLSSPRRLRGLPPVLASLYPSRRHASSTTSERREGEGTRVGEGERGSRAANQERNNDQYNGFFEGLLNAATAAAATAAAPMLSANSCHHDIANVYQNPFDVPIRVCERCGDAVVVPSEQNEFTARSLRCPHSMQRDNRFRELFAIHAEHVAAMQSIETILKQQRALFLRLYEWEHRYSDRAPVNYAAQNNPCYRELSHAVGRYVNALQGFSNVSNDMTRAHRRKFVNCVYRTFPKNEKFFRTAMRHEICKAQPNPMLLPCLDALPECTVCGKPADVRLHAHAQRFEKRAAIIPSAFRRRNALTAGEQQNVPLRQCTCKNFVMCLDCVLGWFWQSSERLQKSFAPCPTCKAEFCLEDIVRVCVAPRATTHTASTMSASSTGNSSAMNVSTATTTTARQHTIHNDDSDESWSA